METGQLKAGGLWHRLAACVSAALLVIPCYRERERLPRFLPALCRALKNAALPVRVRVVDDGSGRDEQSWLRDYVKELRTECALLDPAQLNPQNLGKGGAVYSAWDRPEGASRLAFADADGAVPADEIVRLLTAAAEHPNKAVYAVRTGAADTRVVRTLRRKIAGRVFRLLVRRMFRFPVPDTQCGCKIVPAAVFAALRQQLTEFRFTFDVDLTWHLLDAGVEILSVPIHWTESPGSRLRPASVRAMWHSLHALKRRLG